MTHPLLSGLEEVLEDLTAHAVVQTAPYLEAWLLNKTALASHLTREERDYYHERHDALYPLNRPEPTPVTPEPEPVAPVEPEVIAPEPEPTPELITDEPVTSEPIPAEVAEPEPTPAEPAEPVAAEVTTNPQGDVANV